MLFLSQVRKVFRIDIEFSKVEVIVDHDTSRFVDRWEKNDLLESFHVRIGKKSEIVNISKFYFYHTG